MLFYNAVSIEGYLPGKISVLCIKRHEQVEEL